MGELKVADVRASVALSTLADFENFTTFAPAQTHYRVLDAMLGQVVTWASALESVRASHGLPAVALATARV